MRYSVHAYSGAIRFTERTYGFSRLDSAGLHDARDGRHRSTLCSPVTPVSKPFLTVLVPFMVVPVPFVSASVPCILAVVPFMAATLTSIAAAAEMCRQLRQQVREAYHALRMLVGRLY